MDVHKVLNTIERNVDKMDYTTVHVEIVTRDGTYTLEKEKQKNIGYITQKEA